MQKHVSATELFALADKAKAAKRYKDAKTIYEALAHDPDVEIRTEARFREAMMLADQKRYTDAAVLLRAILDEKPNAARVRLELARMLAAMGEDEGARRQLRQAQAGGLPSDVAVVVNQFSHALKSQQPYGGSLEVDMAPDSNINRATAARTLDTIIAPLTLSSDARQQSGLGFHTAGQGFGRVFLTDDLAVVPRLSGQADLYRTPEFDDVSGSAQVGLEWKLGADQVTPSAGQTWRWYSAKLYAETQTFSVDWTHPIGARTQLEGQASVSKASYLLNNLQNGNIFANAATVEHAFDARTGAGITLDVVRQTAEDSGYATWSGGGSVTAWRDFGKVTLYTTIGLHRLVGDAQLFLFTDKRDEWLYQAGAGATFRQFTVLGFAPVVRLNVERNRSTVALYDYTRVDTQVGVTRAF